MRKGYTLVELLIVITIIGVLTTIAFVGFGKIQADARDKQRQSNATIIAEALEKYYDKNGEYPSVPAVTDSNVGNVKTLLSIADPSVFVMPNVKDTANSITPSTSETDKLAYNGTTAKGNQAQCQQKSDGGCDSFSLQWVNENNESERIDSRHTDRSSGAVVSIPKDPIMNVALTSGSVIGTVSFNMGDGKPACETGSVEYKIRSSTSVQSDINWSTGAGWQTSNSLTHPGGVVNNTQYYFYAIVRCVTENGSEEVNDNVASGTYVYSNTALNASWSGNNATATLSTSTPPMCGSGLTPKYSIQVKVDTASTTGVWGGTGSYYSGASGPTTSEAASWITTPTFTIANANNPSNVSKYTFRGKVRCDNVSVPGTPSIVSNEDILIGAPSTPALSRTQNGSILQWTWPTISCPQTTTVRYTGSWQGNFQPRPTINTIVSGQQLGGVYNDGMSYGLGVVASCGAITSKVLGSTQSTSTKAAVWPTLQAGRGKLYTEYSSGNYAQGRVKLQSSSVELGTCTGATLRYLHVQFARNNTGFDDNPGAWYNYYDGGWGGGDAVIGAGNNLRSLYKSNDSRNDTIEVRTDVYCYNIYIGRNPTQRLVDRYGILRIWGNTDSNPKPSRYYITCTGQSINGDGSTEARNMAHCAGGYGGAGGETLNGVGNAWQTSW